MKRCVFNVKELSRKGGETDIRLDDEFFASQDQSDITGGDVSVHVEVKKSGREDYDYDAVLTICGRLRIPCTRCYEDMDFNIDTVDAIRLLCDNNAVAGDADDLLIASTEGYFDASERLTETILLQIPISHVHPEGKCDPDMLSRITTDSAETE